ncbi:sensor histidine kinase [Xanthomonas massiliensis]|uniref:sensor histidine kinase n=1 Tax=Xanthomonas massiliensis TaxID=1720302 RepID=UPI00098EDB28|nr:ATP-binding protein [Xanthomonas massiliensis]
MLLALAMTGPAAAATQAPAAPGPAVPCSARLLSIEASKALDDGRTPISGWQPITLPDYWGTRWPGFSGQAWYRIQWQPACLDEHGSPRPLALLVKWISLAGRIQLGPSLLWQDRYQQEPLTRSWNMPRYLQLPSGEVHPGVNTVWIRVTGVTAQNPGLGPVLIGDPATLQDLQDRKTWNQRTALTLSLAITFCLGCTFTCIWLWRPSQKLALWHALQSFSWVFFGWTMLATTPWPFPTSLGMARASNMGLVIFLACFCMFGWELVGGARRRWSKALLWGHAAVLMVASACIPATVLPALQRWTSASQVGLLMLIAVQFIVLAIQRPSLERVLFALCMPACIVAATHDALAISGHLQSDSPAYTIYASLASTVLTALLLGRRAAHNVTRIERFEEKQRLAIAQACEELGQTLEHKHSLAMSNLQLQERLQLAHDLHDGLGGQIVRSIAIAERDATASLRQGALLASLKIIRDDLRQIIDQGTGLSNQPPDTPTRWLAPLRHRFMGMLEEFGIALDWEVPSQWTWIPSAAQCLALTRFLEEALTNVIKHSRAHTARVSLGQQATTGELVLSVEDDGMGFDPDAICQNSLNVGMQSMHSRLARIGGQVEVTSRSGRTRVAAHLPPPFA